MDETFAILFFAGLAIFVLFGPWIFLWRSNAKRRREREEDQARWGELTRRIHALETAQTSGTFNQSATVAAPPPVQAALRPVPSPTASPASPNEVVAKAWIKGAEAPPAVTAPPAAPPYTAPVVAPPPTQFAAAEPSPSLMSRFKSALDVEETLGADWLNKLGIVILVLGVAFFLAYELKALGPAGKVLVGLVVSAVMLAIGIWFERNDRYRILARAGVGGGWALLFFTTYAMYYVPAAKVLPSPVVDLFLMLAVAGAMVWHTLRYRSQVVTGLAFLLAFLTVTVSHANVYSLIAGGVLAAGLVFIVGRMQWFELEIVGILASYFNHYLWLRPIIEPMQGHRHPFPEFAASAGILLLYWAIFRVSYVWRQPREVKQEHISTAAALLNTALLLALFKYQSAHPEWAFWALLAIGAVETTLGQLPVTRRRRNAAIVLSTLGVVLLVAAFPFRYSGTRLSVLWLLEAEALLLIGVWTREVVFRRLGVLASALVAGQMISFDAAAILGRRMDGADLHPDFRAALMFMVAALVFYADAHWVFRRWGDLFSQAWDRLLMQRLSYAAAILALVAAWSAYPETWTVVAWGGLALAMTTGGRRWNVADLLYQANAVTLAVVLRTLAVNLESTDAYHGVSLRLITMSLVAVILYVTSPWTWPGDRDRRLSLGSYALSLPNIVSSAYTWAASFLLSLLAWYELRPVGVAVAWVVGGLVLCELGLTRKSLTLRAQAYVAFVASFSRIFFVNLNASGNPGELSPRFYTVVPLALALFYSYWRLNHDSESLAPLERKFRMADVCCYLGTVTIAALMRFEVPPDWVAAAWASLTLALLAVAWRSERRSFLHQGLLIVAGVLFRTVLHNFYQRSYFPASGWQSRFLTVGAVVALLFAALPIAFRMRRKEVPVETGLVRLVQSLGRRPEQVVFFLAVGLLTALLALEMEYGMVTLSWGVEGVGIFLLALWLGERSFRISGLGLLLLCVGKIVVIDVWHLGPRDRYLTFIVLGGALLLVSFLYTRNREALRQYL